MPAGARFKPRRHAGAQPEWRRRRSSPLRRPKGSGVSALGSWTNQECDTRRVSDCATQCEQGWPKRLRRRPPRRPDTVNGGEGATTRHGRRGDRRSARTGELTVSAKRGSARLGEAVLERIDGDQKGEARRSGAGAIPSTI